MNHNQRGDLKVKPEAGAVMDGVIDEQHRGEHASHFHHKHHRVLDHAARIELAHRIQQRLGHDFRIPKTFLLSHDSPFRLVLMRYGLENLPCFKHEVFQDGAQAQCREEGKRTENHDDADQQRGKQPRVHRESAGRRRHALLAGQVTG